MVIQQNAPQLQQMVNAQGNDPEKSRFYEQINQAIIMADQLTVLLEQGTQFYLKLNEVLMRLQQSINDFKCGRDIQKNDLMQSIQTAPQA